MTQPKWTPGKWEVATAGLTDEGVRFVINGAGDAICRLQSRPLAEFKANARLIAAAPQLAEALAACYAVLDNMTTEDFGLGKDKAVRALARAALQAAGWEG